MVEIVSTSSDCRRDASFARRRHALADLRLGNQADADRQEEGNSRKDHKPAGDQIDDEQEDEHEGAVDRHADGVRGEELADELVLGD